MAIQRQAPLTFKVHEDIRKLKTLARFFFQHMTIERLHNFIRAEIAMRCRSSTLKSFPYLLKVEPTNICNLKCPLCPQITGYCQVKSPEPPKYGTLPFNIYTKVVDELQQFIFCVLLYGQGEPFLSKDIFNMIRYASERNIGTMISTNFNISRPHFADEIVSSGLEYLEVSLDGADQKAYAEFRVGGDFSLVYENITRVIESKKRLKSTTPFIEWKFIVMKHNEHQISLARRMAQELGVDYLTFTPVSNIDPSRNDLLNKWVAANPKYRQYNIEEGTDSRTVSRKRVCPWLYRCAAVNCDGSVSPCCYYPNFPQARFGDLKQNVFQNIWNDTYYIRAREATTGTAIRAIGEKDGICYACRSSEIK
jgi:MoaA/NifB/PqqE/SkfB family radical SAM enzyme